MKSEMGLVGGLWPNFLSFKGGFEWDFGIIMLVGLRNTRKQEDYEWLVVFYVQSGFVTDFGQNGDFCVICCKCCLICVLENTRKWFVWLEIVGIEWIGFRDYLSNLSLEDQKGYLHSRDQIKILNILRINLFILRYWRTY